MNTAGPAPFDLTAPLPEGLTLLEASAGTGKTFTIAGLVARYVAEGVALGELLVITFTRAATGELRDRVRGRLKSALAALDRQLAGDAALDNDTVNALLTSGTRAEVEQRRENLAVALSEFDRATIVTTHAFCHEVLRGLGTAGDVARDVAFEEDASDLLGDVVNDFYVRKFARQTRAPEFNATDASAIAKAATLSPEIEIEPKGAPPGSPPDLRARFATNVRSEFALRKQLSNTLSYDDVLLSLAESLRPKDAVAGDRLRQRFRVVLVDEFQDTDPTQWQVLRSAFLRGDANEADRTTVVLVGDPKQAIYSFRGADVYTYLLAAAEASRQTLPRNWRSDPELIEGVNALLDGATLGHRDIVCRPALAAPDRPAGGLAGSAPITPIRVRVLPSSDSRLALTRYGRPTVDSVRRVIAADLAGDILTLLASGTQLTSPPNPPRSLVPRDLAVLVQTNREANLIRQTLEAAGVSAVIHGSGSVFATTTAVHWLQLLEALERPTSGTRARAAALSDFIGWDAARLAGASDREIGTLQADLHTWAAVLERQGVGALVETITRSTRLPVRLLDRPDGERRLTDLHHIAELLHAEAATDHLGPSALAAWLRQRRQEGDQRTSEERTRRLESDADAVTVLTIHSSKGLEFPMVYLPDLHEETGQTDLPTYHDPVTDRRTLDVGPKNDPNHPSYSTHSNLSLSEALGESLREAYVALTRARHQIVLWWGPSPTQDRSPLTRLLLAVRDRAGTMAPSTKFNEGAVAAQLAAIEAANPGRVVVETVVDPGAESAPAAESPPAAGEEASWPASAHTLPAVLSARIFDRVLDTTWRRTSYTALTAAAHDRGEVVASEAEDAPLDDEVPVEPETAASPEDAATEAALRGERSLMADLDRGPVFGTMVHAVLQAVVFDDPDVQPSLRTAIEANTRFGQAHVPTGPLATALAAVIATPLGSPVDDRRLADLSRTDRRDEMGFELPLAGGDTPGKPVDVGEVARLLRDRLDPADPLAAYPDRLGDPALGAVLRGYLTGSIDLLMRVRGKDTDGRGSDRFTVVDYKTNWLGPPGEALSAWHYRPASMADAMIQAHYPLQALLYSVAVHRFLRWRLPGYAPERNLGPILYLFVRGMTGPSTPRVDGVPCGVFTWQPQPSLVADLSDLLEGLR